MKDFKSKVTFEDCIAKHDTGVALLVYSNEMDAQTWIPQSQIDTDSEVWKEGHEGSLVVSKWISHKLDWV